jgi:hypothetical protein
MLLALRTNINFLSENAEFVCLRSLALRSIDLGRD